MTPWHLRRAVQTLNQGGVLAHPTEGVWGLACDPLNGYAVQRLLRVKQRAPHKGLILIADEYERLLPYLGHMAEWMDSRVLPTWPGPVTWILPSAPLLPRWLTGGRATVAVRVTDHPVAAALCAAYGDVLVSTSANLSGQQPALNSTQLRARLGKQVDYVLPGALQAPGQASEIRDGQTGAVLRARN